MNSVDVILPWKVLRLDDTYSADLFVKSIDKHTKIFGDVSLAHESFNRINSVFSIIRTLFICGIPNNTQFNYFKTPYNTHF